MAKITKKKTPKKRVKDVKEFYGSTISSLMKDKNISADEAADLSVDSIEAAVEAATEEIEDQTVIIRRREFDKVLEDDFTKEMESSLAITENNFAENMTILDNFTEFEISPENNDAFLSNAAADAALLLEDENRFRGVLKRSQGILNRTVGIFPKEERLATLVIRKFDAGDQKDGPDVVTIDEFLLTQVSEPSAEKYQIYQTFDQDFIFFFDRNPHIYVYSGVLINAEDTFQWRNEFQREYEANLRGTRCVETGARAILMFEDVCREGYLLELNMQNTSNNPMHTPFSFTFYVVKESNNHEFRFSNEKYDELAFGE